MGVILPRELPSEFQRIEWIGTSGTQYINTQIVLGLVERIKVTSVFYINSSNSSSDNPIVWLRHTASSTNSPQQDYKFPNVFSGKAEARGYRISDNNVCSISYDKKTRMDFEYAPGVQKIYKDGSLVQTYSYGAPALSVIYPIYLMRTSGNPKVYYTKGRLYYFRIEYDGTIREYIPCYRKSDNVVGLFETQTGMFLTNAGTGVFRKGPDLQIDNRSLLALRRQIVNTQPHKMTAVGTDGIASFETNFEGMTKVSAPFTPVQDLHGMQNPYPAGASVNLIPDGTDTENGYVKDKYLDIDGSYISSPSFYISEYIAIDPSLTYTWSDRVVETLPCLCFYDENKAFISGFKEAGVRVHTFTPPEGAVYARSSQTTQAYQAANPSGAAFQLEVGSTATEYRRYSNVCPIEGFTEANPTRVGKNLTEIFSDPLNPNKSTYYTGGGATGFFYSTEKEAFYTTNHYGIRFYNPTNEDITVTASFYAKQSGESGGQVYAILGSWNNAFPAYKTGYTNDWVRYVRSGVVPARRSVNWCIYYTILIKDFQIELGTTATDYEPYRGTTLHITFTDPSTGDPMTVYGGTITINPDGSADVEVNHGVADLGTFTYTRTYESEHDFYYFVSNNNSLPNARAGETYFRTSGAICEQYKEVSLTLSEPIDFSFSIYGGKHRINIHDSAKASYTEEEFKNAMNGIKMVYNMITPQTYHFDNVGQLKSFLGQNNVWTDLNGDPTVTYWERG